MQVPIDGSQTSMSQVRRMLVLASRVADSVVWQWPSFPARLWTQSANSVSALSACPGAMN